tara:strand:+ start:107 stop:214 length:108 start_codon:yes stop_codon:yes gene_type:complete
MEHWDKRISGFSKVSHKMAVLWGHKKISDKIVDFD